MCSGTDFRFVSKPLVVHDLLCISEVHCMRHLRVSVCTVGFVACGVKVQVSVQQISWVLNQLALPAAVSYTHLTLPTIDDV